MYVFVNFFGDESVVRVVVFFSVNVFGDYSCDFFLVFFVEVEFENFDIGVLDVES